MIDVADPTEEYSAARYAREAAAVDPRHHGPRPAADPRRRDRTLLPRADARVFPGPGPRHGAARAARAHRRPEGRRTRCTCCSRASIRRRPTRIQAARSQAARPRARGLLPDRPSPDRALRRHAVAAAGVRRDSVWLQISSEATAARVAARSTRSSREGLLDEIRALLASGLCRNRTPVQRARLPPGARAPARRARRGGDARTNRAREPALLPAAVDLVQERA